jgi:hypothetical protein
MHTKNFKNTAFVFDPSVISTEITVENWVAGNSIGNSASDWRALRDV